MKNAIKTGAVRTFQKDGKWIERPRRSEILLCACGNKYIKTRKAQATCVRCMFGK